MKRLSLAKHSHKRLALPFLGDALTMGTLIRFGRDLLVLAILLFPLVFCALTGAPLAAYAIGMAAACLLAGKLLTRKL